MTGILNALIAGVSGAVKDAYFNLVSLLLPGNGTNGAQNNTFLDSSTNNFTITRNGNTTQGTFSPFSQTGWGNYFSGGANYLTAPNNTALDLSTGDFTVELWFYPTSFSSTSALVFRYNGNYATGNDFQYGITVNTSGAVTVRPYQGVTDFSINAGTAVLNSWNHIALVRTGNTFWGFVNGNRSASSQTITGALNNSTWATTIGATLSGTLGNTYANGYISNVRITKGGALYTTATYTVPTTALTTTVSAGTVSLLTCQSNRFLDNSSNAFTISTSGSPSVVAFSPFAPTAAYTTAAVGGSGYFDGTGDYLNVVSDSNLALGTGDFTIEMWMYPTLLSATVHNFFDFRPSGTQGGYPAIYINNSAFNYYANSAIRITNSTIPTVNAWNHIALVRSGTTTKLYLNGAQVGNDYTSDTTNYLCPANRPGIGGGGIDTSNPFPGYLSNIRILKGTALYTGTTYTVPTAPPAAITNTQLLLNFTNAGITDATAKNDLETVGNAQISTTVSKFGGGSIYLDGTSDYLSIPQTATLAYGTGNFTVEFWLYRAGNVTVSDCGVIDQRDGGSGAYFMCGINTSQQFFVFLNSAYRIGPSASTLINQNTWYHIAYVRSSTTGTLYINGSSVGSWADNLNYVTNKTLIGRHSGGGTDFNGYLDDIRITNGYARYTSNFTVPSAPFPVQ